MIVTPFGDLEYESHPMTLQWLAAHSIRHGTYRGRLSRLGTAIRPAILTGDVDDRWVSMHYLQHVAFQRFVTPGGSTSVQLLASLPTVSEGVFYNWHRQHNLLHQRLDQTLGVV